MKYIWLIGSNNEFNLKNDSFYFWKNSVSKKDEIDKYFVMKKNPLTKALYKNLSLTEKKYIIWKNSYKHLKIFLKADIFYVPEKEEDILPTKIFSKKINPKITKPVIILEDKTNFMSENEYEGKAFNNNIFKVSIYDKNKVTKYKKVHNLKNYQIDYNFIHPKYVELLNRATKIKPQKQILWVVDRDKLDKKDNRTQMLRMINRVLKNKYLRKYQEETGLKIKICLSSVFKQDEANTVLNNIDSKLVKVVSSTKIDYLNEICRSSLLITDNSSLGYDFTFMGKPALIFNPNLEEYVKNRNTYYSEAELTKYTIKDAKTLVNSIISEDYKINEFFKKGLPNKIDSKLVLNGTYLNDIYDKYKNMQLNNISFIGYNFYGRGGTVSATYALAEALLEKGYLVHMMSLKQTALVSDITVPYGLNINYIYSTKTKRKIEKLKKLVTNKKHYSYFKYDTNIKYLIPYAGYGLKKYLHNVKAHTVVSTRDSFHFFLKDADSKYIKNKIYFFHADANVVDKLFPGATKKLASINLEKCAFVTETNRLKYIDKYSLKNYNEYAIVGNALTSSSIISKEEIHKVSKKNVYKGIYLTRISKDRVNDLNNAIKFAQYLKDNKIDNIVIDIYGKGDYVEEFEDLVYDLELEQYLNYKGLTLNPHEDLVKHDFCIDFSLNQSFGMTYIEGVLNGLQVFAYHNYGSDEVLKDIPDSFIESNEDLVKKISNLHLLKKEKLVSNYENITSKYSREVVADNFIKLLKK